MCFNPYKLKAPHPHTGEPQYVPCGKCPECRARIISGWSFRLMQEEKASLSSWFVTLTYDSMYVPYTQGHYKTLNKKHVQLFMKRLRRLHGTVSNYPIKYFAVGEYGDKHWRPHYHLIIFNTAPEFVINAWKDPETHNPIGQVHFGQVSAASVGYTLKYMCKEGRIPLHRNDDRVPEFRLMSKGLGLSYITMDILEWHHADEVNRMHCVLADGKKISMPRYYKDWIYQDLDQRQRIADHLVRESIQRNAKVEAELYKRYGENTCSVIRQSQFAAWKKMINDSKKRLDL